MSPTPATPDLRITAPHRLRLSALLDALLADARRRATGAPAPAPEATLPPGADAVALHDPIVIDSADGLTVGEILDATAHAGFGFVIALLALVAIPFVGVSTPFGLAIAFVGGQMLLGRPRPWLPRRVRRFALSVRALDKITRWLSRMTRWMTHLVRPRLPRMARGRVGQALIGFGVVVLGIGLALPLPIPGSNMVFIVPILVYGIGLLEEDGLLIALGHLATLVHIGIGIALWEVIGAVLVSVAAWFGL